MKNIAILKRHMNLHRKLANWLALCNQSCNYIIYKLVTTQMPGYSGSYTLAEEATEIWRGHL